MVRIGATGHRLLTDHEKLSAGIETALRRIEALHSPSTLTVVSSLAQGADCLIATHVIKRKDARLIVPLPLPVEDYLRDFTSKDDALVFHDLLARADEVIKLPPSSSRKESYEAAGDYVLNNCDVLLTIWDGQPAQGRGGTSYVVERARQLQLPVAWVHAGNRKKDTNEPTSLGEQQGLVTFERMDEP
jgi:hypothetical protein